MCLLLRILTIFKTYSFNMLNCMNVVVLFIIAKATSSLQSLLIKLGLSLVLVILISFSNYTLRQTNNDETDSVLQLVIMPCPVPSSISSTSSFLSRSLSFCSFFSLSQKSCLSLSRHLALALALFLFLSLAFYP